MHAWEAIQRTIDYIEENIGNTFSVEELAALAALSPFYYQRLFSRLVGRPVREYIRLRRLANACAILTDRSRRILDIALDCGFGSHAGFSRAFKEAYGMTPEAFRQSPVWLNHFDKPDLLLRYTMIGIGVPLISDGLVLEFREETLKVPVIFAGVSGYVPIEGQIPLGKSTGVDIPAALWERFHREKQALPRIPGGRELGVAFLGDAPAGSFTYFCGAEVASDRDFPGFQTWRLPAREYIVCRFEAESFAQLVTVALNKAVKYSALLLKEHGLTTDMYSPEVYDSQTADTACMELWMAVSTT